METDAVTNRAANPSYDEGMAFAHYVDIASEGGFRKALGRGFAEILAAAFILPDHDLSHQYVAFAESDGVVVGMVSGYTAAQHERSGDQPLREAPGNRVRRSLGLTLLGLFQRIVGVHAEGEYYLQFLAVDEEFRGMGVGSALLGFMEERAYAHGCRRFTIDVSAKNHGAARLYERFGMADVPSKCSLRKFFVRRLAKDLEEK